jgi:hypothetical protein
MESCRSRSEEWARALSWSRIQELSCHLSEPLREAFAFRRLISSQQKFPFTYVLAEQISYARKQINNIFTLFGTSNDFSGRGEFGAFHCDDRCLVSGPCPPVMMVEMKLL